MCFQGDRLAPALRPSTSPASASWREGDDDPDPDEDDQDHDDDDQDPDEDDADQHPDGSDSDPDAEHDQHYDVSVQEYNSPPSPGTLADITMQELGQHQPRDQPIHLHHPHHLHYLVDHNGHQIHNTWP